MDTGASLLSRNTGLPGPAGFFFTVIVGGSIPCHSTTIPLPQTCFAFIKPHHVAQTLDNPSEDLLHPDVRYAFLHGQLSKTVYMHQPPGFVDSAHPDYVCHLQRSLYGLKQAHRAWFQRFASFITGRIITLLHSEFAMIDLGSFNYFLGVSAQRSKSGLFLSQSKFIEEILERAHMQHCNPCKTPVDTESKLCLQYLTFTRPDISYAVQQICLYMHDPRDPHFTALKRILRYSRSSAEAEYRGVANVVAETAWIRNLLLELHTPLSTATLVYCDNVSVVYLSTNPVQHQRTKHIEIDIHFVREYVASGQVRVLYVPSRFQYANIFTKGLPTALFLEFRSSLLNVQRISRHTGGSTLLV
ncbi:ribonuclease H-like domain-containing protein [Tanacetum coccineum]